MVPSPAAQIIAMAVVGLIFVGSMPLLIWMVSRVLKRIDDLNLKVGVQNGRIGKIEVWRDMHQSWSDRESDKISRALDHDRE